MTCDSAQPLGHREIGWGKGALLTSFVGRGADLILGGGRLGMGAPLPPPDPGTESRCPCPELLYPGLALPALVSAYGWGSGSPEREV